jgi:amino acid transporter
MMTDHPARSGGCSKTPGLRRALTFWPLVFYGLSEIVGAGIYVAIGEVITRSGDAAPLSFLLAGIAAGLTGLCYAELAGRFPEAAGAASYVRHVFGSDVLSQLVGASTTLAVAIAAAAIANGAVQYLMVLIAAPAWVLTAGLVICFTMVAIAGVRESVGLAAGFGVIEIGGLLVAIGAGLLIAPDFHMEGLLPRNVAAWNSVMAGSFIAFFAFLGFETLANMAEEVKDARRVVPRGIITAIAISIVLYILVATAVTVADRSGSNPLVALFDGGHARIFAAFSAVAIANGVLVGIVMLSRLFYGMARTGQLPSVLGQVGVRTQTPITATLLAGALILVAALAVPFEHLLAWTNALTLGVFIVVDVALYVIRRRVPVLPVGYTAPRGVPMLAASLSLTLLLVELLV